MIQINLMPDVKQELLRAQKIRTAVVSTVIILGIAVVAVAVLLAIYVYAVQSVRNVAVDNTIKTEAEKLASVEDLTKTLTIQNQLAKLPDINGSKRINSRVYDLLNVTVPGGDDAVTISRLVLSREEGKDQIEIEAQAVAGFRAAELFKKQLDATVVRYSVDGGDAETVQLAQDVVIGETSYGQDQDENMVLRFTLTFGFAEELFSPQYSNVQIGIPQDATGNVTDSYIGVPRSIFADRATDLEEEE